MRSRSNEEWAKLLSQEGTAVQAELFTDLGNFLYRITCRYIDARSVYLVGLAPLSQDERAELAHDFVQQALIAIHQNLADYRGEGAFLNWAATIAIRKAGEELRRAHWQTARFDPTATSVEGDARTQPASDFSIIGQPPDIQALTAEMWDAIIRAVQVDLSDQQRRAFLARFVDDCTNHEIAAAEGVTPNVIYQRIHQARLKIKRRLEVAGYDLSDSQ